MRLTLAILVAATVGIGSASAQQTADTDDGPPPEALPFKLAQRLISDREAWAEMGLVGDGVKRGTASALKVWLTSVKGSITVCMDNVQRSLDPAKLKFVADTAKLWQVKGVNHIPLDFGEGESADGLPRPCDPAKPPTDIRISFDTPGRWSLVGNDSLRMQDKPHEPSMSLNGLHRVNLKNETKRREWQGAILHEFGHALGLEHEHQSPFNTCRRAFDVDKIKVAWMKSTAGFDPNTIEQQVRDNLQLLATKGIVVDNEQPDPISIMMYPMGAELMKPNPPKDCVTGTNLVPSERDRKMMADLYPADIGAQKKRLDDLMAFFQTRTASADGTTKKNADTLFKVLFKR